MSIMPLPQFEADLKEYQDELAKEAAALKAPKTMVVRFGSMGLIGEYPYNGSVTPGCGSRVIARTHRGTELATLLTVTCTNAGCGSSITRKQMLGYFDASGGKDYPFFNQGRVLRIATAEDMQAQEALEQSKHELVRRARDIATGLRLPLKIVDAEPILGGERLAFYYLTEDRVDLRQLHSDLTKLHGPGIELRQVGSRDEARLIADYERCGQQCCCKNFLKVLKPISMRSAKVQKATLEPLKISGRCGRLMCCLRYEDETYEQLRKRLPHRKSRVGTPHGDGIVISSQILTQLVLVSLDTGTRVAVPVEELGEPGSMKPPPPPEPRAQRERRDRPQRKRRIERTVPNGETTTTEELPKKKKRRRRRKKKAGASPEGTQPQSQDQGQNQSTGDRPTDSPAADAQAGGAGEGVKKKKKRRRRRRKPNPDGGSPSGPNPMQGPSPDSRSD